MKVLWIALKLFFSSLFVCLFCFCFFCLFFFFFFLFVFCFGDFFFLFFFFFFSSDAGVKFFELKVLTYYFVLKCFRYTPVMCIWFQRHVSVNSLVLHLSCCPEVFIYNWAVSWQKWHVRPVWSPSLIRVFAIHMKKACILIYPLSRKDSDQTGRTCHFVGFVTMRFKDIYAYDGKTP